MKQTPLLLVIFFMIAQQATAQYLNTNGTNEMTGTLRFNRSTTYAAIELGSNVGGFIDFKSDVTKDFDARIIYNYNNSGRLDILGNTNFKHNISVVGNVGIGTTTPTAGLHVSKAHDHDGNLVAARFGGAYNHWTYFGPGNSGRIRGTGEGYLWIESNAKGTGNKLLYLNAGSPGNITMAVGGGNVLVGKITQLEPRYRLDVNGAVRANEIVVNTSGADFVFESEYNLPELEFVERYILENKHLPEIPSAAIMQEQGMAVGDLSTKLLQKIEELTLYLIEQNKINKVQEQEIADLRQKLSELSDH